MNNKRSFIRFFAALAVMAPMAWTWPTPLVADEYEGSQSLDETLRAANKGTADAQNSLGIVYRDGLGVPRDYKKSLKWFRQAAEQGLPEAQYNLALMHQDGKGVARDDAEARKWLRQAADKGFAEARYHLGVLCLKGQSDLPANETEARQWFRSAAEQGLASAQYKLGMMCLDGRGGAPDEQEAARWLRLAADQEFARAQTSLGMLHAEGRGVEKDPVLAVMWFGLAAQQGDPNASKQREALLKTMTPEQIAEAQKRIISWTPPALEKGRASSQAGAKPAAPAGSVVAPQPVGDGRQTPSSSQAVSF
ncbi:MAG: sel1 repeat family protein [Magnetococcales bacterium]|nr:sel1 repeat family protein [Magnetococcales bacterium]